MRKILWVAGSVIAISCRISLSQDKTKSGTDKPATKCSAVLRIEQDTAAASIPVLSWDTEGGDRAKTNLLRKPIELRLSVEGGLRSGSELQTHYETVGKRGGRYRLNLGDGELIWDILPGDDGGLAMRFSGRSLEAAKCKAVGLVFPFDPRATATTILADTWDEQGRLSLPAVISAPDLGQMLLTCDRDPRLLGRFVGDRARQTVDFTLEMPAPAENTAYTIMFEPVRLPAPRGLRDTDEWRMARRGWFNALQVSACWGKDVHGAPAGILANNVISDPVSCLISLWADQAFWTPEAAPGVSMAALVRRTVDWWILNKTRPSGEVVAYWDHVDMLDANASPLIAAWDYVESTGDRAWLKERIERLEFVADYLVKRDIDDDGLVESTHSGNDGTLIEPMRADSAYDTINAGHKNAYCNALAYRAFRCLADLERQLGQKEKSAHYTRCADRLRAAFYKTFYNAETGLLAWWISKDGMMHDPVSPMINSLAICHGLVDPVAGRKIMDRVVERIEAAGFKRFDLGVPINLVPFRRGEYLSGIDCCGVPKKEDGSDTFGEYLNGGCLVSDAVYFITALHIVGKGEYGDRVLKAMLDRQDRGVFPNGGGFQNGVVNTYPGGAEFFTWEGKTCGYEGHLTYSYAFLQAILLRDPAFRARLYRPMLEAAP